MIRGCQPRTCEGTLDSGDSHFDVVDVIYVFVFRGETFLHYCRGAASKGFCSPSTRNDPV